MMKQIDVEHIAMNDKFGGRGGAGWGWLREEEAKLREHCPKSSRHTCRMEKGVTRIGTATICYMSLCESLRLLPLMWGRKRAEMKEMWVAIAPCLWKHHHLLLAV